MRTAASEERRSMATSVFLLPGRGNRLPDLGDVVAVLGHELAGIELTPPFSTLPFPGQLEIIREVLGRSFWSPRANLIGHSYGGYLLLHALLELEPFPGRICLLSPVLGATSEETGRAGSRPPRGTLLLQRANAALFPIPSRLEIHVGELDAGCSPQLAERLVSLIEGAVLHVVPGQGHQLPKAVVHAALSQFLNPSSDPSSPRGSSRL